jgi:quinol monooxygenase YgiN
VAEWLDAPAVGLDAWLSRLIEESAVSIRLVPLALTLLVLASAQAQNTFAAAASTGPVAATKSEPGAMPSAFVVKFKVKPGMNAAFEQAFKEMQAGVRAHEPGNLYYDFFVTVQDPQTYVIVERYRDAAAISAHGQSEHGKKLFATLHDLLDGPPDAMRLVLISEK